MNSASTWASSFDRLAPSTPTRASRPSDEMTRFAGSCTFDAASVSPMVQSPESASCPAGVCENEM